MTMAAGDKLHQCGSGSIPRPIDVAWLPRPVSDAQRRQTTVPRLTSQNCRMDRQASQTPTTPRSRTSLDKELEHRLEELHLDKDDASSNSRTVEELGEIILSKLKQSYSPSFHWDKLNSGSYYDKTKVRHLTFHSVYIVMYYVNTPILVLIF